MQNAKSGSGAQKFLSLLTDMVTYELYSTNGLTLKQIKEIKFLGQLSQDASVRIAITTRPKNDSNDQSAEYRSRFVSSAMSQPAESMESLHWFEAALDSMSGDLTLSKVAWADAQDDLVKEIFLMTSYSDVENFSVLVQESKITVDQVNAGETTTLVRWVNY